jgi:hypothetical protein
MRTRASTESRSRHSAWQRRNGPSIVDQLYAGAELTHDFSVTVEISLACETRPQRQDAAAGPQEIEIFYQAGI